MLVILFFVTICPVDIIYALSKIVETCASVVFVHKWNNGWGGGWGDGDVYCIQVVGGTMIAQWQAVF